MKLAVIVSLAAMGMLSPAKNELDMGVRNVSVYVRLGVGDTALKPVCAEGIASRMFSQAGVRINWRTGEPRLDQEEMPVVIDITSHTSADFHPGALAYAQVFEGVHIRIFWDRVQSTSAHDELATKLLAHVMVHEITHILEGIRRHSSNGIMKARWSAEDIEEMAWKPLTFDPEDVELIHNGLAKRNSLTPSTLIATRVDR